MQSLTTNPEPALRDVEFSKILFAKYRSVFHADRLRERVIFWVERQKGFVIVRVVNHLRRERKSDDRILGRVIDDPRAIRILIGNFAAGCVMSAIRWEVYEDFSLERRMDCGRFDFGDLLADLDLEGGSALAGSGISPQGNWDFDAIMQIHRCPICKGVYNRNSIIYIPDHECDTCHRKTDLSRQVTIMKDLLMAFATRMHRIPIHGCASVPDEFPLAMFIDPIPNSIMFWTLYNTGSVRQGDFEPIIGSFPKEQMKEVYQRSLFPLIATSVLFKGLLDHLQRGTRKDWRIIMNIVARLARRWNGNPSTIDEETDSREFRNSEMKCCRTILPRIINELILTHDDAEARRRSRKRVNRQPLEVTRD